MEIIIGLIVGIGLSAACGFRVFVPMMGMSIASLCGNITLSPGFAWMGTWPALIAFSTATVIEIGAYYIPWLDHVMDALMTPSAVVAGTILTASMLGDMYPFLKWCLAIIAGGGVAAVVQGGTVALLAVSTGTTGGARNFLVSTTSELGGSIVITILAILVPFLCLVAVVWICWKMIAALSKSALIKKLFG